MEDYNIRFDKYGNILIYEGDKLLNMMACSPANERCDVINLFQDELSRGYTYNFTGLILITTTKGKQVYCRGKLIAEYEKPI